MTAHDTKRLSPHEEDDAVAVPASQHRERELVDELHEERRTQRRRRVLRRHRRRRLPPISVLPTLCTLGNLVAGFAAMHYAARDPSIFVAGKWTPIEVAALLIFVGMLLDAIDGSLARLTGSSSDLGAQIDSLADVVTFGVAPAFIVLRLVQHHLGGEGVVIGPAADSHVGRIIWAAAAVYVCCAALRLARYNAELGPAGESKTSLFRGLPSPGAAGTVASLILLHQDRFARIDEPGGFMYISLPIFIAAVMLACGIAMVSPIPYVHVAKRYLRVGQSFTAVVRIVVALVLLIWFLHETLAATFLLYALGGPVHALSLKRKLRRQRAEAEVAAPSSSASHNA